jgi:hypothetical protein
MWKSLCILAVIVTSLIGRSTAWGAESGLRAVATRENTAIQIKQEQETAVVDVTCPFGIDHATLTRVGEHWPAAIVIRMRVKGLESFEAVSGADSLGVSVPSTDEPSPRISLRQSGKETVPDKRSPYWTEVRIVAEKKAIPLENGYFEIPLPAGLFEGNPRAIELRWVDFYRN